LPLPTAAPAKSYKPARKRGIRKTKTTSPHPSPARRISRTKRLPSSPPKRTIVSTKRKAASPSPSKSPRKLRPRKLYK
jgi:hypothetical protein